MDTYQVRNSKQRRDNILILMTPLPLVKGSLILPFVYFRTGRIVQTN